MSNELSNILQIPERNADRNLINQVDLDRIRGREIAGPFFDAGGIKVAMAHVRDKKGDLHSDPVHWFHLIIHGKMQFKLGQDLVTAESGDLVCIPAGFASRKSSIGQVTWIYVALADIPMWAPLKTLGPTIRRYESTDLIYILVSRIIGGVRSQDVYSIRCAFESSQMLVTVLERELHQSASEWTAGRVTRLVDLLDAIRAHPAHKWDRAAMARHANICERNLTRVFKRAFNMPPGRMLMIIRMDIASRMLMNTDLPLTDVAATVGYDSPFSFSRIFRKCVGVPPRTYRQGTENRRLPAAERKAK